MLARRRRSGFVDGRGSRLAVGRMPLAGAGVPAASGSRSWCRRRRCRARPRRPARARWRGRRRATPRTAAAAPRSAGPSPGRAKSPPDQRIEHKFDNGSATVHSPTRAAQGLGGPRWGRNSAEPGGQQRTAGDNETSRSAAVRYDRPGLHNCWSELSHGTGQQRPGVRVVHSVTHGPYRVRPRATPATCGLSGWRAWEAADGGVQRPDRLLPGP